MINFGNPYETQKNDLVSKLKEKYSVEYEPQNNTQVQDLGSYKKLHEYIGQHANQDMWIWTEQQEVVQKKSNSGKSKHKHPCCSSPKGK